MEYATYLETLPEDKKEEELASIQPKKRPKVDTSTTQLKKLKQMTINNVVSKLMPNSDATEGESLKVRCLWKFI